MKFSAVLAILFPLAWQPALAGDPGKQVFDTLAEAEASFCDWLDGVILHRDKDHPVVQELAMTGRLQADAAFFRSRNDTLEHLGWRRARNGFKATVFQDFTVHAEADFDLNDRDPFYQKLTDAYLGWSPGGSFSVKAGKHSAPFTMDGSTSSKNLLRMERSLLAHNLWFPDEYHAGVSASGRSGKWSYLAGTFSSAGGREFGDFDAGWFGLLSLGYDFAESLGLDKAMVRADYVNNDPDENNAGTRDLAQVGSLNGVFEKGPWGLRTDVAAGDGYGDQSDLFALAIMPYRDLTEKLQVVASYNYVASAGGNGVRLDRYESHLVSGRADEAHEFYAGVNWYLCGHQLKWQAGVEYTTASDRAGSGGAYDGWGFSSGVRMSW